MRVTAVELRDFRNYERASVELGPGLTIVAGPNGAGKTNLLEAVYFACLARSPRTSNERELIRAGATVTRVTARTEEQDGTAHTLEVGFTPGEPKAIRVDGAPVDNLSASTARPLASVFLPERLELVKGAPSPRRAHLDRFVAAVWPARAEARTAYSRTLSQRNALLGRIRAGASSPATLDTWDAELARHGLQLMADRREAVTLLAPRFAELGTLLGLPEAVALEYRPALGRRRRGGPGGRAGRAPVGGPRARVHRARPTPRRPAPGARRPVPAPVRLPGPAAGRPPGAPVRRARRPARPARHAAADAPGRRHVRAGRLPPRAPGRPAARGWPEPADDDRAGARARRRRGAARR